ncbi:MAG: hypothetical protein MH252_22360 [Thermosynechococcaceae cyanobacterium MS004]|nr:hypothetical protein [Thermosynechococcaceae cyanobacterium MS004]
MQTDLLGFVIKVLLASAFISVGIKALGPQLLLPPTSGVVLAMVFLPSIFVAVGLVFQYRWQRR